jgi:hypothetical protein
MLERKDVGKAGMEELYALSRNIACFVDYIAV